MLKFIPRIVIGAADQHKALVASVTSQKKRDNEVLTLKDLKDELETQWRLSGGHSKSAEPNDKGEVTLIAFEGKCNKCGIMGHMAKDCRAKANPRQGKHKSLRNNRNKGRFQGKCHLCHKTGHMKENCFELAKNASRRPRGWKSCLNGNETSNVALDEDDTSSLGREFALMSFDDNDDEESYEHVLPNEVVILNGDDDDDDSWPAVERDSEQQDHLHAGELEGTCHHGPEPEEDSSQSEPGAATQQEEAEPPQEQQAVQQVAQAAQAEDPEDDGSSDSNPWDELWH